MTISIWATKGAVIGDKTACKEYMLTQEEIIDAINKGKLQYNVNYSYGNPYFKLIRKEVETLATEKYGEHRLKKKKLENELVQVNRELRGLKSKISALEKRKVELLEKIGE
ncbi:MAG: hypothetical protein BWK75_02965 [Candidatus Altiarchaeales archaeon A3]|nr:MAG: hypothetical protein BWK75_02965 [Candidatus Altiarchaeales archaeon A3]